jgi:hypothetical protein
VSFSLAFWFEDPAPDAVSAYRTYDRLTEGEAGVVDAHVRLVNFLTDLLAAFGNLDEDNMESAPWASPVHSTDECVIVAISGARSSEVVLRLLEMASSYNLVTYDPQNDEVVV